MKRRRRLRLLILLVAVAASLVLWSASPRFRAALYEQGARLGPDSLQAWSIKRLEALGADGAPSLVSLLDDGSAEFGPATLHLPQDSPQGVITIRSRAPFAPENPAYEALIRGAPESLPALAAGLSSGQPSVRFWAACILDRLITDSQPQDETASGFVAPRGTIFFEFVPESFDPIPEELRARFEPLVPELLRGLEAPENEVRAFCFRTLSGLPARTPSALPRACEDMRGFDTALILAARATVRSAGAEAVPELKRRLPAWLDELERRSPTGTSEGPVKDAIVGSRVYGYFYEGAAFVPFNEAPLASAVAFALEVMVEHEAAESQDLIRALRAPELELRIPLIQVIAGRPDLDDILNRAGISKNEAAKLSGSGLVSTSR